MFCRPKGVAKVWDLLIAIGHYIVVHLSFSIALVNIMGIKMILVTLTHKPGFHKA